MPIDQALLQRIKKNDVTLKEISLRDQKLVAHDAIALAQALKTNNSVTLIDLHNNQIGAEGAAALAQALEEKSTSLTSIDLQYNEIGAEGAKAVAKALKINSTVTSICLGGNEIGDEGANALAEALKINSNSLVTKVLLGNNKIGVPGARALADALKSKSSVIEEVHLQDNKDIGDEGAKALATALAENTSLTMIYLYHNQIGAAGATDLAQALEKNTSLTLIDLRDSQINPATQEQINKLLACNRDYARVFAKSPDNKEEKDSKQETVARSPESLPIIRIAEQLKTLQSRQEKASKELQPSVQLDADEKTLPQEQNVSLTRKAKTQLTREEQENVSGFMEELRKQLAALATQQTTTAQQHNEALARIKAELDESRKEKQSLEEKIEALRHQPQEDFMVRKQLQMLEEKVQPLLDELNERQEISEQQEWILRFNETKLFYQYLQSKLNQIFLGWMAGVQNTDNTNTGITLFGKALDIPTLGLGSHLTDGINAIYNQRRAWEVDKVTAHFPNFTAAQTLAERVARNLTLRYEVQIKTLTLPGEESRFSKLTYRIGPRGGVQTFAECVVQRIIEGLKDLAVRKDTIDPRTFDKTLVDCVSNSNRKLGRLGLSNKRIETKPGQHRRPWTDLGILRRSGMRVKVSETETQCFVGDTTNQSGYANRPDKYYRRWATKEEVDASHLHKDNSPEKCPGSTDIPQSFFRQLNNVPRHQASLKNNESKVEENHSTSKGKTSP